MWIQFFLENAHFAINLFTALVLFSVFWLYYDAWKVRKNPREVLRLVGYFLLSLSFVLHASSIESTILATSLISASMHVWLLAIIRIPAYLCIAISLATERLEKAPEYNKSAGAFAFINPATLSLLLVIPQSLYPVLAVVIAYLYTRRATVGLEDHLKPVALSMYMLAASELLSLSSIFIDSGSVAVFRAVAPFGPIWIASHILLLFFAVTLGKWIFGYLLKQFETQLFMFFTTMTLAIFLVTTVSFTGLLVKNIQDETVSQLQTNVKVLSFTIDSKSAEALSDVQIVAKDPKVIEALVNQSRNDLASIAETVLLTKKESSLVITNDTGQVLARGEDKDRSGASLSSDPLMKRALLGESGVSVVAKDGVLAPDIFLQAATPVYNEGTLIGVVMAGVTVDNAFVDGLKQATGLESVIYGNNRISASTISSEGGKSRMLGIKEEDKNVKDNVLIKGLPYSGPVTILQTPYFGAYLPLKDIDTNPVGMLFVGKPQYSVLQTAGRSIELTFLVTVMLLIVSVVPAYAISKYIADQI